MPSTIITTSTVVPPVNPNQNYIVTNSGTVLSVSFNTTLNTPVAVDGGEIDLYQNGTLNNALIGAGGRLDIIGGVANNTEIAGSGTENIRSNASSQGNVVDRNGILNVGSNGGGALSGGNRVSGTEIVSSAGQGGTDTGSTISTSGLLQVNSLGTASQEIVSGGGRISVLGGSLNGATVTGQGSAASVSYGNASNVTVSQGGTLTVGSFATVTGDVVGSGGTETLFGTETSATIQGGTLAVQTSGTFQKVKFDDSGSPATTGTLLIAGTTSPTGTISGFGPKDVIDLQGLAYAQGGTATLGANDVLTVTENGRSMSLQLDPAQSYAGDYFALTQDAASGGTNVTMMQASANPQESITLSAAEKHFAGQVSFNISAFDPTPFADMVSLIQNSPQAYFNAVHAEAKDPLLLAALADPATGAAKRSEIGNAALQLASAIAGLGAGSALQTAAAITAGAIHQIEAGQVGMGFVNNALQNKAGTILTAENHVRPY